MPSYVQNWLVTTAVIKSALLAIYE